MLTFVFHPTILEPNFDLKIYLSDFLFNRFSFFLSFIVFYLLPIFIFVNVIATRALIAFHLVYGARIRTQDLSVASLPLTTRPWLLEYFILFSKNDLEYFLSECYLKISKIKDQKNYLFLGGFKKCIFAKIQSV